MASIRAARALLRGGCLHRAQLVSRPLRASSRAFSSVVAEVAVRDAQMRERHEKLNMDVPASSLDPSKPAPSELALRKKRLIYRCKQRGWLEVDLLLGAYAARFVPAMDAADVAALERLAARETPALLRLLLSATDPALVDQQQLQADAREAEAMAEAAGLSAEQRADDTRAVAAVLAFASSRPLGRASPAEYARVKEEARLT